MTNVRCRATVDPVTIATLSGKPTTFKVQVWGEKPFDFVRNYTVFAGSEDNAAQEGMRRFVDEMEKIDQRVDPA